MKICNICKQKADIYTTVHKKQPFIDGKNYECMCFTCFFVPKIEKQKYDELGQIAEHSELPYCCENICNAKELLEQGSADTLKSAKVSVEAVKKICSTNKNKKITQRPRPEWNIK